MKLARSSAIVVVGSLLLLATLAPITYAATAHSNGGAATVDHSVADVSDMLGRTSGGDNIRLVAVLLGAAIGTCLLLTPRRPRFPIERPREEPPEDDPEPK